MAEICAYLGASVDGYIANQSESVQFLEEVEGQGDNGYAQFYASVDVVIMGGKTFRWLLDNDVIENPYKDKRVIVISSQQISIDWDIEFYNGDLNQLFEQFKPEEKVWIVGGGNLISKLINLNLLTSLQLTIAPTILSGGVSLFNEIDNKVDLKLRNVTQYNQFVELDYMINYR